MELPKVLIVDDRSENIYALEMLLKNLDVKVLHALSGPEALGLALEHDFCVAVVDIQMPEMDGYELVTLLRSNEGTSTLPVIFVSAIFSDEYHHRKGYEAGAVDFMTKPFVPEILLSKIRIFIELYQQRNAERQRRRLAETIEQVGRLLTSNLDLAQVPSHILEQLHSLVPFVRGEVLLREESHMKVIARRGFPEDWPTKDVPIRQGDILHQITTSRSPLLIDDVTAKSVRWQSDGLPVNHSWMVVPLVSRGQVIGTLTLSRSEAGMFSPEDLMLVNAFSGQAAVALENARLYDRLARFNEELDKLVKKRTDELEKANQALARADKIKSDFITVAAHELRTPLTLIRGYAGLLKPMLAQLPDSKRLLEGISTGETRLLEIVNNLLDISKIEGQVLNIAKVKLKLGDILHNVCCEFEAALAERKQTLALTGVDELPIISADPDLMFKLFDQLLSNAIKYTPDGGSITVTGQLRTASDFTQDKEVVEILVSDTGIGIDPAYHEMIFDKFFQAGPIKLHSTSRVNFMGGGPGLGLSIARGVVQAHGGGIWVESPGFDETTCPGSCFHVYLPIGDHTPEG